MTLFGYKVFKNITKLKLGVYKIGLGPFTEKMKTQRQVIEKEVATKMKDWNDLQANGCWRLLGASHKTAPSDGGPVLLKTWFCISSLRTRGK